MAKDLKREWKKIIEFYNGQHGIERFFGPFIKLRSYYYDDPIEARENRRASLHETVRTGIGRWLYQTKIIAWNNRPENKA